MDTERLKKIDLFQGLQEEDLERLAAVAHEASMDEGSALVKAGAWSYQMFAIEEGTVEVQRDDEVVATLEAGDVVGETGAVERALRNASAIATSPLRVIFFTQADIGRLRKAIPDLDERLQAILRERERQS
jgi:CRP/FNR family transcriptional regulator, cyclic AMP receptor protein